jgi:hypothetical protein
MTELPAALWPWLALAGLGMFHGINPAMGWLFAVALGLHRHSQRVVLVSLIPIAGGHAVAVGAMLAFALALGLVFNATAMMRIAGVILIAWALWHAARGHRARVHVGMQTGLLGLAAWSFLMAAAHGAGLMLVPVVGPICITSAPSEPISSTDALSVAAAAVGVHTLAMLATIATISIVVYRWVGVAFLRRGWVNLDLVWCAALLSCGAWLLAG